MLTSTLKGPDGKVSADKVLAKLNKFEQDIDVAERDLGMRGKTLERANQENSSLQHYYESCRIEIYTMMKFVELSIDELRGRIWTALTNQNPRDMTDRAKERQIDSNDEVLKLSELLLETKRIHDQYSSIVESFRSRGFQLRNITELRVNQIHNDVM